MVPLLSVCSPQNPQVLFSTGTLNMTKRHAVRRHGDSLLATALWFLIGFARSPLIICTSSTLPQCLVHSQDNHSFNGCIGESLFFFSLSHFWSIFPHKLLAAGFVTTPITVGSLLSLEAPLNEPNATCSDQSEGRGWGSAPVKGRGQTTLLP